MFESTGTIHSHPGRGEHCPYHDDQLVKQSPIVRANEIGKVNGQSRLNTVAESPRVSCMVILYHRELEGLAERRATRVQSRRLKIFGPRDVGVCALSALSHRQRAIAGRLWAAIPGAA